MKNAFTIDFEDWYQSLALPEQNWKDYESRIHIGHEKLLTLLQKHNVKATYYILGDLVERFPEIIREIQEEGHEIGCHSFSHYALYDMTPDTFSDDIDKCQLALSKITEQGYTGFRAPMWSLDKNSWWALDIIKEKGFQYDSSIYPGDNKRTGIPGYRKDIHFHDNGLLEIPCCTFPFLQFQVGLGGAYFRILPYSISKNAIKKLNKEGKSAMFYVHPWELDPHHPKIKNLPPRRKYPHYFNLKSTEKRIDKMLSDFEFTTLSEILKEQNEQA